ncbi:hypothetical protein [Hyphomicrobium sp. MC8b]|uniref:hypothetical protein n=1 Tax=Hyphomicrobium sp. MC8b TaxID=300273 RepID=UPI00391AA8AB
MIATFPMVGQGLTAPSAAPAIIGATQSGGASSSAWAAWPDDIQPGDLIVSFVGARGAANNMVMHSDVGFLTQLHGPDFKQTDDGYIASWIFYRFCDGSEDGGTSYSGDGVSRIGISYILIRGADPAAPFGTIATASGDDPDERVPVTVNVGADGSLVLVFSVGWDNWSNSVADVVTGLDTVITTGEDAMGIYSATPPAGSYTSPAIPQDTSDNPQNLQTAFVIYSTAP